MLTSALVWVEVELSWVEAELGKNRNYGTESDPDFAYEFISSLSSK